MTTATATGTSTELAQFITRARDAIKAYKASLSIDMLIGDGNYDALDKARAALWELRVYDPGTRCGMETEEGKKSTNGVEAWEAIVAACGIKGGTAHVRKDKMADVKAIGKAIMSAK